MDAAAGGPGGAEERPTGADPGSDPVRSPAPEPVADRELAAGVGPAPVPEARGSVVVQCPEGLHARPCHALVSLVREHESELRVECAGREVSGDSILELMTLAAGCGAELHLWARGPDAELLLARLMVFVRSGFTDRG